MKSGKIVWAVVWNVWKGKKNTETFRGFLVKKLKERDYLKPEVWGRR
jgi:hypothetical protein